MKALVIGYGSMGRRRIRLLKKMIRNIEIICLDSNPDRVKQITEDGHKAVDSLDIAISEKPDIAFVCTSPGSHADIMLQLAKNRINIFTELNLVSAGYGDVIALAKKNNVTVFMSSTMLYNKQIQKIDEIVKNSDKPVTYIYHIGQYLPDWHPWESYKDFFIGKKQTNGVREIYAIQLPWIINTFGKINELQKVSQRCTGLDIEFNDSIIAMFKHENGNIGTFIADTVARKATTYLEIISEDFYLSWHGHNDDLMIYDIQTGKNIVVKVYDEVVHENGYADNIIENQYIDEIQEFLDTVYEGKEPRYSLKKDMYTLELIDKIEG